MTNFNDILNAQADSIKPPPLLPQGKYRAVLLKFTDIKESKEKKTPFTDAMFKLLAPIEVEDEEALKEIEDLGSKELRSSFYLTADAASRFRDFLRDHLHIHSSNRSLKEMMADGPGQECGVVIVHNTAPNGNVYANIGSTFGL